VDPFEAFARAGIELAGMQVDEIDLAVMRAANDSYGPALAALDAADLREIRTEPDMDPSRPPRDW